MKKPRGFKALTSTKNFIGIPRLELNNLLLNMKEDIISHLVTQLNTLHVKKKQEVDVSLTEYCPHCRQEKVNCKCKKYF